ncbi:hypothetical protein BG011_009150 [Mortierella polycephala]|uniref:Uncharacterized protein n=1 Tax=Mortierella polycephala TaxID=41804 RepID=A0A9P6QH71_9FUNG|nr:hypothetical protein BG011_009150 [Mortierella polycephala]
MTVVQNTHDRPADSTRRTTRSTKKPGLYGHRNNSSNNLLLDIEERASKPILPPLQIPKDNQRVGDKVTLNKPNDNEEVGYFGDILDRYCHHDNDYTSPLTASPTSPFSKNLGGRDFTSAQPPTPPASSRQRQRHNSVQVMDQPRKPVAFRHSTAQPSGTVSAESSPMLAASARFHSHLQSGSNKDDTVSPSLYNRSMPTPAPPTTRPSTKRSLPAASSNMSATSAPSRASAHTTASFLGLIHPTPDQRVARPELSPRDISRRSMIAQALRGDIAHAHLPLPPSGTHNAGQLKTFPDVVDAAMNRNKMLQEHQINPNQRSNLLHQDVSFKHGYDQRPQLQQWQQQQYDNIQEQHPQETRYSTRRSLPALTPTEMLSRRFEESTRPMSQGSLVNTSASRRQHQQQKEYDPLGLKPAFMHTPFVHTRAKGHYDSRKVFFGDMITVVSIERPETPPPLTTDKKKAKKKSKKSSSRKGPRHDPEYDSDYYNEPYTPEPAEVIVKPAPWIGNPNYDEEQQNSSFYDESDPGYEYDYEYEAPSDDTRLEAEDSAEDDLDENEDKPWGSDISSEGRSHPKKRGGLFKFKRAVNRLLRN